MTSLESTPGPQYRSRMACWDRKANVRAVPRRIIDTDTTRLYFSPDVVAITSHPWVVEHGEAFIPELLTRHLYRFLDFTTILESLVVNPVALAVANGLIGVEIPREMRFDAYKLYCDEAYHALYCEDLKQQVERVTGVALISAPEPRYMRELRATEACLPNNSLRSLARIFFVIVSETLISHTLTNVPDDPRVDAAVREVIADHAQDEGRHNAYFASLLKIVWPRLSETQKDEIGPLLPGFILGFLAPDLRQIQGDLEHAGVSTRRAVDMLQETYSAQASAATARAAARSTLRHFAEANVFSHGPSADAFYANDLLI